jgi:hypothetical protein
MKAKRIDIPHCSGCLQTSEIPDSRVCPLCGRATIEGDPWKTKLLRDIAAIREDLRQFRKIPPSG